MKRRVAALCLALLATAAAVCAVQAATPGGSDDALGDILSLLAARRSGHADFVEQKFLKLLKRPVESSGELLFRAPDHLEMRTLLPHRETFVLDGDRLTLQRDQHRRVLDLQSLPQVAPFIDALRATLAGDRAALEAGFALDFRGDTQGWTLLLVPRDRELARAVAQIRIEGSAATLLRVETLQGGGSRSLVTLRPRASP